MSAAARRTTSPRSRTRIERFDELRQVLPALQLFGDIDEKYVAKESLIREFIGGGIYEY